MSAPPLLPSDLLRTFVAVVDDGGMSAAGLRVGRSQSAVSLQVKRLEELTGTALFRRDSRDLALTSAGETLLPYARRLLALNDQAMAALAPARLTGVVRLGVVQDFAETALPRVLARFAEAHPAVALETRVGPSAALRDALAHGGLDVCLAVGAAEGAAAHRTVPMAWLAAEGLAALPRPLPLALLDPPCTYRAAALAAVEGAGIAHRIAYSGPGLSAATAAVRAGLATTAGTADAAAGGLVALAPGPAAGRGPPPPPAAAPPLQVAATAGPAARRLAAVMAEAVQPPQSAGHSSSTGP
ncbi:LysR substrate-binding domain-containing protein [Caenispirillum bisanense]|uniref:LysR substrate-binding domain-containing protein n=1 Tax=Caenispirillum bisanense TaxID=414052 RepID=UPI0031DBDF91